MEITIVNQSGEKNWSRYRRDFEAILQRGAQVVDIAAEACLSAIEWCLILIMIFLVITMEFINSAIEETVNYISLQRHPMAKRIKDLSAAAVLLMSICALCVAVIIIGGKLF